MAKKVNVWSQAKADRYETNNFGKLEKEDEIHQLMMANNFYERKDIKLFQRFNRFGFLDPYNTQSSCREYLFFVKPDLHIFNNKDLSILNPELGGGTREENDAFPKKSFGRMTIFSDAMRRYKPVLKQLQSSATPNRPFVNLLSNMVSSSLDLPGITADTIETARNIYGSVTTYRLNSIKSDTDFDFTLEFKDTKYLDVYMFFKLYDEYERKKFNGEVTPPDTDYIFNRVLHDQMAIYKFIVGEDGESIIYWAKLTGVYPTSVPRDSFSNLEPGEIKFSVSFKCSFVEDMNPDIFADFNRVIKGRSENTLPLYNRRKERMEGEWPVMPYIGYNSELINGKSSKLPWKLKWRRRVTSDGDDE